MKRVLRVSRYLIGFAVIGSLLLTAAMMLMGIGRIVKEGIERLQIMAFLAKTAKEVSVLAIEVIDLFLVGTVSYVTAVGLYKLFLSKDEVELPVKLNINSLTDLENKIIGVIVAALAVSFLGHTFSDSPEELLSYGGGVALVIAALGFFMNMNKGTKKKNNSENIEIKE